MWPTAESLTPSPHPGETSADTFSNAGSFELGDRRQDVHLQFAGWRRRVNPFRERHERYTKRLQFFEQRHEVLQIAPEPIQAPDDEHVEPTPSGVRNERIQRRPAIL